MTHDGTFERHVFEQIAADLENGAHVGAAQDGGGDDEA